LLGGDGRIRGASGGFRIGVRGGGGEASGVGGGAGHCGCWGFGNGDGDGVVVGCGSWEVV